MSYIVLARKYRPNGFEDLVGQEHVSRTLANAIAANRVAHAFLFTGVRGVGKTTAARILAKAINCMGDPAEGSTLDGPTATPCLKCPACLEIRDGVDVDVREIDGASYNGVDEVRKLQDSLPYRPARDRYKIFIVDEVHMLSTNAWNAFLKTLEEPPEHVKFIFATTEVHKVPVTILSRVQRFDFKLISTQQIGQRLAHVLKLEGVDSDDSALSVLAREAAGSMRDAMSLLDQVIAWNPDRLEGDAVARVLGVASRQVLHDIARALVEGDAARCLRVVSDLANQGYDIGTVARDILALLRDLVVAKVCKDPGDLLDLPDEERRDVTDLAAKASEDDLIRLHQGFATSFDQVVRSGQSRAALEMLLVRLARRPPLIPMDDLVVRLAGLEKRLAASPARDRVPSGGRDPSGAGQQRRRPRETRSSPTSRGAARGDDRDEPPYASGDPAARPVPAPSDSPATRPPEGSSPGASAASPSAVDSAPESLAEWGRVVEHVRQTHPHLAAVLQHATPLTVTRETIALSFEAGSVFLKSARSKEAAKAIRDAAKVVLGGDPNLTVATEGGGDTVAAAESRRKVAANKEAEARARTHPLVDVAQRVLGARVKEIRLPES